MKNRGEKAVWDHFSVFYEVYQPHYKKNDFSIDWNQFCKLLLFIKININESFKNDFFSKMAFSVTIKKKMFFILWLENINVFLIFIIKCREKNGWIKSAFHNNPHFLWKIGERRQPWAIFQFPFFWATRRWRIKKQIE